MTWPVYSQLRTAEGASPIFLRQLRQLRRRVEDPGPRAQDVVEREHGPILQAPDDAAQQYSMTPRRRRPLKGK